MCHVTPLSPHNVHLSPLSSVPNSTDDCYGESQLYLYIVLLNPLLRQLAANLTRVINDGKILELLATCSFSRVFADTIIHSGTITSDS